MLLDDAEFAQERPDKAGKKNPALDHEAGFLVKPGRDIMQVGFLLVVELAETLRRVPMKIPLAPTGFLAGKVDTAKCPHYKPDFGVLG